MKVFTANDNPGIEVWYNGRKVGDRCTACKVPNKAGRLGFGWVDLILVSGEEGLVMSFEPDADGAPLTRRLWGFVRWASTVVPSIRRDGWLP